ncbi:hypothetical protein [Oxynema aestuarii]|uniref:Uncharacterized protein n=1 Tax=Oxynema aestuarii AP17 TaxID=2064643 RepID=A0A6H1U023_9CYAN|nr:hypothetical protein [Oxynema aestuarii]QIZ72212.1 hypothetical protein HCG48_17875 [Oxynema aestuarii AP17]RMH75171.1 MAG: hypothetical protein D6680_12580 [Cyanobacteria bacterium J007]
MRISFLPSPPIVRTRFAGSGFKILIKNSAIEIILAATIAPPPTRQQNGRLPSVLTKFFYIRTVREFILSKL